MQIWIFASSDAIVRGAYRILSIDKELNSACYVEGNLRFQHLQSLLSKIKRDATNVLNWVTVARCLFCFALSVFSPLVRQSNVLFGGQM